MNAFTLALGSCLVTALAACGGASPPPQSTATQAVPAGVSSAETTTSSEPAASAELATGIKAFDAGNYADARSSFEAALKKNPRDYQALFDLGMACEKLQDKSAAERAYRAALEAKPDLDAASAELSALLIDEGRADEAIAVARAGLAKRPGSAALHENLGVATAAKGDQDQAVRELQLAVQAAPDQAMFHLTLAHWLDVWHVRGATPHLEEARRLAKDDYGMVASVGHEYRMAGEFEACVKTFDEAIAIRDGGEVRTERALCRLGLKDDRATFEDLSAAVANDPTYAPAHYYLAGRLATAKRFKEAAAEYAKYLDLDPNGSLSQQARERLGAAKEAMAKDRSSSAKKK
ncbi:MAG TPA: tetratricopeptide repeat protein [Polyangiaceae bacterium]|nr:tetratricopeptide repeat protein [Polyangiaceae bacterium]